MSQIPGFGLGTSETVVEIDPDGGVTIKAPSARRSNDPTKGFHENLALRDELDEAGIAEELLDGVEMDIKSREGFLANYTNGIDLLGLETKNDKNAKTSQIGHPLLLEAVVRAQSAAGAELMPAGGPCKVENVAGGSAEGDDLAAAFQTDINTYLTSGAPEYYPDTDRMLFGLFYSGNAFKKVYMHPLRKRPVSETVGIEDLIVSEDATDLETALRVTHRSEMSTVMVKRMQKFADWCDEDLGSAQPSMDMLRIAQERVQGTSGIQARPKDVPHEIYEITADLDLGDYGIDDRKLPDLPLSYICTIDKQSRKVLAVRRGWKDGDDQFKRRQRFVHYGMVPSFNFLCLGFMHLLGNQTQALRGIWRLLVTSGMYSNAPGGVKVKSVRMGTNDINPGPGEWPDIDIGSLDDIRKALMPMPYKDVSPVFMQLAEAIGQDSMRMAGMAETEMGEGRTNVPVGTMMSMIEVSTQTMSAVHKRLHRAQARELELIRECFVENPEALAKMPGALRPWDKPDEFANCNLLPASDPNVPSQIHRIQLATALVTVAQQNPTLYDMTAVHKRAWKTIGVNDADAFVLAQPAAPPAGGPPGPAPPDPLIGQARMLEAQAKMQQAQQASVDLQRKAAEAQIEDENKKAEMASETQNKQLEMETRQRTATSQEQVENTRLEIEKARLASEHTRDQQGTAIDAATAVHTAQIKADTDKHKAGIEAHTAHTTAALGAATAATQADTDRHVADTGAATARETAKTSADTARHATDTSAKTATKVASMKPKPAKPAGKKKP
jgi:hypothetical protein